MYIVADGYSWIVLMLTARERKRARHWYNLCWLGLPNLFSPLLSHYLGRHSNAVHPQLSISKMCSSYLYQNREGLPCKGNFCLGVYLNLFFFCYPLIPWSLGRIFCASFPCFFWGVWHTFLGPLWLCSSVFASVVVLHDLFFKLPRSGWWSYMLNLIVHRFYA